MGSEMCIRDSLSRTRRCKGCRTAGLKGEEGEGDEDDFVGHEGYLHASLGVNVEKFGLERSVSDFSHTGRNVPDVLG